MPCLPAKDGGEVTNCWSRLSAPETIDIAVSSYATNSDHEEFQGASSRKSKQCRCAWRFSAVSWSPSHGSVVESLSLLGAIEQP